MGWGKQTAFDADQRPWSIFFCFCSDGASGRARGWLLLIASHTLHQFLVPMYASTFFISPHVQFNSPITASFFIMYPMPPPPPDLGAGHTRPPRTPGRCRTRCTRATGPSTSVYARLHRRPVYEQRLHQGPAPVRYLSTPMDIESFYNF